MQIPPSLRDRNVCVLCRRTWAHIADMNPDRKACGYLIDIEHTLAICFRCEEQAGDLINRQIGNNKTHYYDKIAHDPSASCAVCGTLNSQDRPLYKIVSSPEQGTAQFLGTPSTEVGLEVCKECVFEIMQLTYIRLANSADRVGADLWIGGISKN